MSKILDNTNEADSNAEVQLMSIDWYSEDGQRIMEMTGDLEVSTIEAAEAALPKILAEMIEVCNSDQECIDSTMEGEFRIYNDDESVDEIIKCSSVKTA